MYTIAILDFTFTEDPHNSKVRHEVKLTDIHTHKVFYDKLTFIYLTMPRFTKTQFPTNLPQGEELKVNAQKEDCPSCGFPPFGGIEGGDKWLYVSKKPAQVRAATGAV